MPGGTALGCGRAGGVTAEAASPSLAQPRRPRWCRDRAAASLTCGGRRAQGPHRGRAGPERWAPPLPDRCGHGNRRGVRRRTDSGRREGRGATAATGGGAERHTHGAPGRRPRGPHPSPERQVAGQRRSGRGRTRPRQHWQQAGACPSPRREDVEDRPRAARERRTRQVRPDREMTEQRVDLLGKPNSRPPSPLAMPRPSPVTEAAREAREPRARSRSRKGSGRGSASGSWEPRPAGFQL